MYEEVDEHKLTHCFVYRTCPNLDLMDDAVGIGNVDVGRRDGMSCLAFGRSFSIRSYDLHLQRRQHE